MQHTAPAKVWPASRSPRRQPLGEFESGLADVDRAVDMSAGDVDQRTCAMYLGHARDDRHRQLRGRAVFVCEQGFIVRG